MGDKIRVIQLGKEDFSHKYQVHPTAEWMYEPDLEELPGEEFELVIIDRPISGKEKDLLFTLTRVGALFVLADVRDLKKESPVDRLFYEKLGNWIKREDIGSFLLNDIPDFFGYQYGEKYKPNMFCVSFGFDGQIAWEGHDYVSLAGEFGDSFRQIGYWRNNIPINHGQTIELWLEYEKDKNVKLSMEITLFESGQLSKSVKTFTFDQSDINQVMYVKNDFNTCHMFVSLKAKGSGNLKIKALHDRHSRNGKAVFIPGGKRCVTKNREEIFYYLNPGNLKPPLNIYFSGYKTMESFEGYNVMKRLGSPFLLISEARLEGGAFYLGDEEYEKTMIGIIEKTMSSLGFDRHQVIMSGLSMGSFGALYYGSFIRPHTILVGKPLINLGDIAQNEHLNRPGGFPTSIDVAKKAMREKNIDTLEQLNQCFWDAFEKTDFSHTNLAISYMIEDDYDMNAYHDLQEHLHDSGVTIYGKGIHGRHNDATSAIVKWFLNQFEALMRTEF